MYLFIIEIHQYFSDFQNDHWTVNKSSIVYEDASAFYTWEQVNSKIFLP